MRQAIFFAAVAGLTLASLCRVQAAGVQAPEAKTVLPPALSADDLAGLSGGASPSGVAISESTLTAVNAGNSVNADSVVTGNVSIGAGAFDGFNGVGNFVFNTGNNNNVQGSLNITILAPAN